MGTGNLSHGHGAGFCAGFAFSAAAFAFEQVDEALRHRMIPTGAATVHALRQIVLLYDRLPFSAGELPALVGMHLDLGLRLARQRAISKACNGTPVWVTRQGGRFVPAWVLSEHLNAKMLR